MPTPHFDPGRKFISMQLNNPAENRFVIQLASTSSNAIECPDQPIDRDMLSQRDVLSRPSRSWKNQAGRVEALANSPSSGWPLLLTSFHAAWQGVTA